MNRTLLLLGGGFLITAVVLYLIHTTNSRYYLETTPKGIAYRIDKKTGQTWLLAGESMTEIKQPGLGHSFPEEEKKKVTGTANLSYGTLFTGTIYNGSTWYASKLVLSITTEEPDGTIRWTRQFVDDISIASFTTGTFSIPVSEIKDATFRWAIVDVQGYLEKPTGKE
ncbi:hypothetical protein CVU37_03770 [candidate division BRC1 bacterium HGW-BRC1-1]|jgi:hypothetical protein|nr:MAG: hypothetical protein CVU37_03770 [candidate division BRC1 bacterium HGW-BRC1-1]